MTKTYTSYTHVAFSVVLEGGKSKRVSFAPRTGSGSVFYTDDEKLQKAIEKHPAFGKKFFLAGGQTAAKKAAAPVSKKLEEAATASASAAEAAPKKVQTREIPFTNLSDAKEYLAKTFEIGRTQLRSKEAIKKYAALHGVIFVGIDDK